ncbi:AsmA family protein [Pararhodobacter zhoushanensis]|uniref:AsmA family protein n=1 Tax=Pararhodobacter zhoushanensis TaxID=2479545 RepID=A0ABT3H236_9RHOB|nr:AsmA family protein [Pararhodobacter zhoushanensis]MCW1933859.1 AsmA family protein [Pararhodobacter zhoushanensis]
MRLIIRLLGVVVVLVVMAVAALFLLPAERIANLAARQFEAATGRSLTISGDVTPTFWPVLGARVEGVTLANIAGSDAGPMLVADSVDLGVDLSALIQGNLVVRRFEARSPQIVLERDASGVGNWMFAGIGDQSAATTETGTRSALPPISLDRAQIEGASLRYIDRAAGTDVTVQGVSIDLTMPESGGAATLRISLDRNGQTGEINARLGSVSALLAGDVVAVSASISADGAQGSFEGRLGLEPVAAEGRLSIDISRLGPALQLAGAEGGEPIPGAARPLTLGGQLTLAPAGSLHVREGVLGIGSNRLRLALDTTFDGDRPNIAGQISADTLDLTGFTGGESGGSASGGATGWPTARIDASALALANAQIGLTLGPVNTGFGMIDSTRGSLTIDRARAVLGINEIRAFDGTLSGELVANNRNGLSVGGTVALRGVSLLAALRQAVGFERLSGTASADLRFLGSGQSVDAIMRSLEGQGTIAFGAGEILGFDLAAMLRNLDASALGAGNSTIYESIGASFTMANGVLTNSDLRLEAPLLGVGGNGTVDLGNQTLNYRVTPEAMRNAETGEALRVPLLITGPWSAPRYRLDLEGLAEQRLAEERARLEARAQEEVQRLQDQARSRVEQELADRLGGGTTPEGEAQTPEDALRDQARDGLLRLLGGRQEAPANP